MEDVAGKNPLIAELTKVVQVLTPLSSEDRVRLVSAAFAFLGDSLPNVASNNATLKTADTVEGGNLGELPLRARTWMRQTGVSPENLQQVFHLADGNVEI